MTSFVEADPAWTELGSTSNADFFEIEPNIIAVVPHRDSIDAAASARESIAFQDRHWQQMGHRGAAVVFMDNVLEQTSDARAVYATETSATLSTCYALVSASTFAQAAAAVFTGLAKPGIPTQIFPSLEEARPWIDEINAAAGLRRR